MSKETFLIVKKELLAGNPEMLPVANYVKALSENICTACAKNNIDLLNPKPEQVRVISDLLISVINEGTFAGAALLQYKSIIH